ncbi:hypothetical protein [Stakelama tenebrarum]|uniref:Uncharacterized protein n=1 Tax=Stakelama tenebrarum TaxID=2711215 RepID=A0A6G6Y8A7_9SPHN|nr:hypothetical protein [Sphingosinithalassobacter tenebrarum]QIG81081.1 hypothetical protein G5C33_15680 [Sphingosinithalassobacter tenebrarum]
MILLAITSYQAFEVPKSERVSQPVRVTVARRDGETATQICHRYGIPVDSYCQSMEVEADRATLTLDPDPLSTDAGSSR